MASPRRLQSRAGHSIHVSPDRTQARNRLDTLLTEMRTPDTSMDESALQLKEFVDNSNLDRSMNMKRSQPQEPFTYQIEDDDDATKQIARNLVPPLKRSARKERRVVFELRGKPFELKDKASMLGVFRLCRTWMHGKDDESHIPAVSDKHPYPTEDSLDLLATKEILALPEPKPATVDVGQFPQPTIQNVSTIEEVDLNDAQSILNGYMGHWQSVRRTWTEHSRKKEARFTKSLVLLETVFNIAQQHQLMLS